MLSCKAGWAAAVALLPTVRVSSSQPSSRQITAAYEAALIVKVQTCAALLRNDPADGMYAIHVTTRSSRNTVPNARGVQSTIELQSAVLGSKPKRDQE